MTLSEVLEQARQLPLEERRLLIQSLEASFDDEKEAAEDDYYSLEKVYGRMYERARRYWRVQGDTVRAALSDDELKEQFWLFDQEGIPRLKADTAVVDPGTNPLLDLALSVEQTASGHEIEHVSDNFDEVLRESIARNWRQDGG